MKQSNHERDVKKSENEKKSGFFWFLSFFLNLNKETENKMPMLFPVTIKHY